jgi:hypothetical protein
LEEANSLLNAISIVDRGLVEHRLSHPHVGEPKIDSGTLVITTQAPHTILSPSEAVCSLLGFSDTEMAMRSIRLFYGPETNPKAIPSAIKRMLLAQNECYAASVDDFTVYSRNGAPHAVRVECSRLPSGGINGAKGACRLRLEWQLGGADAGAPVTPRPTLPAWFWNVSAGTPSC